MVGILRGTPFFRAGPYPPLRFAIQSATEAFLKNGRGGF